MPQVVYKKTRPSRVFSYYCCFIITAVLLLLFSLITDNVSRETRLTFYLLKRQYHVKYPGWRLARWFQ